MVEHSRASQGSVPGATSGHNENPAPVAKYEDIVADPQLFMTTLENLHSIMGTKFMIPIIGGKDLDLHKLFVEVTSRGGVEKILREKRWKEVTSTFNFPCTATNASFVLRKYYYALLQHYEQIYYSKVQGSDPSASALQGSNAAPSAVLGLPTTQPPPSVQMPSESNAEQQRINTIESTSRATAASSVGTPVVGVVDGKFDGGYLVTVRIGNDTMKGVFYHTPPSHACQMPRHTDHSTGKANSPPKSGLVCQRRRRRKKSELRKRDPSHPKPNRSGYNFFFAEQHARLKALPVGKDREISRKIGELWHNLKENEKAIYQEKAVKDKERYMAEMKVYREQLRENQVISDAEPLRQRFPCFSIDMVERHFSIIPENDSESSQSETEEEDDDMIPLKDDESFSETETPVAVGVKSGKAVALEEFQIVQEDEKPFEESDVSFGDGSPAANDIRRDSPSEAEN